MPGWADDPELLATFRAEVEERVASLSAGLLQLESHPSPRQVIGGLFRDAHTVKGSARMLGLDGVLQVAHRCEDLLGGLRDGRLTVRRDLIDLLLASCDGITSAMPGVEDPVPDDHLQALAAALDAAIAGEEPVTVPQWSPAGDDVSDDDDRKARGGAAWSRAQHMREQGLIGHGVQHLGQAGTHARPLAGCEHHCQAGSSRHPFPCALP